MAFLFVIVCMMGLLIYAAGQYSAVNVNSACNYFKVQPATAAPSKLNLDLTWYKKFVDATPNGGMWILGSSAVSDQALLAAARISAYMLRKRPDIQSLLMNANVHVKIMAVAERSSEGPDDRHLTTLHPLTSRYIHDGTSLIMIL